MADDTILEHLDRHFDRIEKRFNAQDKVLLDISTRLGVVEGGEKVRTAMAIHVEKPKPAPVKRLPRWQRVTLQVVAWAGGIVTSVVTAYAAVRAALAKG